MRAMAKPRTTRAQREKERSVKENARRGVAARSALPLPPCPSCCLLLYGVRVNARR